MPPEMLEYFGARAADLRGAVTRCVVDQLHAVVTVDATVPSGRLGIGTARAAARAGPGNPAG